MMQKLNWIIVCIVASGAVLAPFLLWQRPEVKSSLGSLSDLSAVQSEAPLEVVRDDASVSAVSRSGSGSGLGLGSATGTVAAGLSESRPARGQGDGDTSEGAIEAPRFNDTEALDKYCVQHSCSALDSADLEPLFGPLHARDGSKGHYYISDGIIRVAGPAVTQRQAPYNWPNPGKYYRARYGSQGPHQDWFVVNGTRWQNIDAIKRCLHGKWLHIAGDSTGRQLYNSLIAALDVKHHHHTIVKNDDCLSHYHMRRMALLKQKPKNKTALEENHLWMCDCRQHLIWWSSEFSMAARDDFDFRLTYSYKELMFEVADQGMLTGDFPKRRWTGHYGGNLFHLMKERLPDIMIANSGPTVQWGYAFRKW